MSYIQISPFELRVLCNCLILFWEGKNSLNWIIRACGGTVSAAAPLGRGACAGARFERDVDVRHVAPCTGRRRGPHDLRERRAGFLPRARDGEKFSHCAVRMRSELSHLDRRDREAIVTRARRAYSHRGALAHVIFTQNTLRGCVKKGTLRDCARHSSWSFGRTGETRTSP